MADCMRYDIQKDEMVPVTQEWVNETQALIVRFGLSRDRAKEAIRCQQEFLDAWKPAK